MKRDHSRREKPALHLRVACDSLVALGNSTASGAVLFAKNSDRPAAECQPLVQLGRRRNAPGARLRCQYVEIPEVEETARLIGSRPFWLWGFEHGLNEYGVAVGNHTVFTRDPLEGDGLIGMDLVRLGLERSRSARQAAAVIGRLIEEYGQGGSGYHDRIFPYHNSFLIADREEAFLLETSDRHWALRRIADVGSASNHLSIDTDWTELSRAAVGHAVERGWWDPEDGRRFDFASAYRDESVVPGVLSSGRHRRTCELLAAHRGGITAGLLRDFVRDHYGSRVHRPGGAPDDERYFSVCMHADPVGTTTASMVAELRRGEDGPLAYWACLGSPCVGVFLPLYLDGEMPAELARGGEEPSPDSPWWRFKALLTRVESDFERHAPRVRAAWDEFEQELARRAEVVERQAVERQRAADRSGASALLTRFMAENVTATLARLENLLAEID